MSRYYYHGEEFYVGAVVDALDNISKILDEGLLTRSEISSRYGHEKDPNFDHVCLYKKNDELDYDKSEVFSHSARAGWIDNGFVIIVDGTIPADKATVEQTNLIDEWRSRGSIPPTSFVGIALPFDSLKEYLDPNYIFYEEEEAKEVQSLLSTVIQKATDMGLAILDSDEPNFTDAFDQTFEPSKKEK